MNAPFYMDHEGPEVVRDVATVLNEHLEDVHVAILLGPDGLHLLRSDGVTDAELAEARHRVEHLGENWNQIVNEADGLPDEGSRG